MTRVALASARRCRRSLCQILLVLAAVWSVWLTGAAEAFGGEISAVRIGQHGEKTRIVVETDQPFAYRIFQLNEPTRLIIDLPGMVWAVSQVPTKQGRLISQFRFGLFRPDVLRLVWDLSEPAAVSRAVHYQNLAQKWLLVMEIQRPDSDHPRLTRAISNTPKGKAASTGTTTRTPASPKPTPKPRRRKQGWTVMLDPGHGGPDPGAVSRSGGRQIYEKDIVLQVARRLQQRLRQSGVKAVMTRKGDYYLPLAERFHLAQKADADLFVSLHADSARSRRASGASIYTLSDKASDKEAAKLAQKENASDILVGVNPFEHYTPDVQQILLHMSQRTTQFESNSLARILIDDLGRSIALKSHAMRSAGFAVLKSPTVPSVLVEMGYLSHKNDLKLLRSTRHQQKIANALAKGILTYLRERDKTRLSDNDNFS